ncbi:ATP-dependent Clp protease proteolytic subunit [Kordiimonas aestuarii]|uniref:ATP-dependent Clp protease proteolytic subunit n=1 Tax=Kordiimonas aestuarii TaxID=1005925 RepID=UPI0021D186C3|nr:ATP-dependent Clp protease proteolytic subunit [Kordiimonas aestuarii]
MSKDKDDKDKKSTNEQVNKILFDARKIFIVGDIDHDIARDTVAKLMALDEVSHDPITIVVSSPGGHVESGDMIHDMIKFVNSPVKVLGTGWVASAGALIFVAADKKNRFATPNTRFLLHQPSGGISGNAANIDIQAMQIVKMRERLNKIFAEATGQTLEKIEKDVDRDFWLTCDEAVKYGIVGKVVKSQDEIA